MHPDSGRTAAAASLLRSSLSVRFALTAREAEVSLLLAEGPSDSTIARQLAISLHTTRRYSERALVQLGVHSRAAVAVRLLRNGVDGA